MSATERQGQVELNMPKAFFNAKRLDSAKFGYEVHFMLCAAIVAFKNGTEGFNFYI